MLNSCTWEEGYQLPLYSALITKVALYVKPQVVAIQTTETGGRN